MRKLNQKGFTTIEVMAVVIIIAILLIVGFFIPIVIKGNYWYTVAGVERELKVMYPEVRKVLIDHRNIFSYSEILVEFTGGEETEYCIDTNFMFDYDIFPCEKNY